MAKLVSISRLRDALAKESNMDLNSVLNASLEAATPSIEGFLLTTMTRSTGRLARYVLDKSSVGPGGLVTLCLPQAFLNSATLEIKVAATIEELGSATPVPVEALHIDATRGYSTLFTSALTYGPSAGVVSAEGTYGFDSIADEVGFRYQGVPSWLEQAAIHAALEVFDVLRQTNDTEVARKELKLPITSLQAMAMYRRIKQPVVYPI